MFLSAGRARIVLLGIVCLVLLLSAEAAIIKQKRDPYLEEREAKHAARRAARRARKQKRSLGLDIRDDLPFSLKGNSEITTPDGFKNPKCLPWYPIRDALMSEVFGGVCGDAARAAVRLAFHDAGTYSRSRIGQGLPVGGADGSLLTSPTEVLRSENNGLQAIVDVLKPYPARFNVSNADIIHVAGVLAVISCPGGPAIETFIGRKDVPADFDTPDGLLPSPNDSGPTLVARFADLGFTPSDLSALVGAHSTAKQRFVDVDLTGERMDTTVDIWDVRFYGEILNSTQGENFTDVFHLQSDLTLATDPNAGEEWRKFVTDQDDWVDDYAEAHAPMSVLGQVQSLLTQCNEILPPRIDITQLLVSDTPLPPGTFGPVDGNVDPDKLAAAIKELRAPWLNASAVGINLPVIPDPKSTVAKRSSYHRYH